MTSLSAHNRREIFFNYHIQKVFAALPQSQSVPRARYNGASTEKHEGMEFFDKSQVPSQPKKHQVGKTGNDDSERPFRQRRKPQENS